MTSLCFYFKVHQPFQLRQYHAKDVDVLHCYEDAEADRETINRLADTCYLPANNIIYSLIDRHKGKFKISYSISGTALELFQMYRPDVIGSFKKLVETGGVEILAETYYHSLSSLYSANEFKRQIERHSQLVQKLFNVRPTVFRNTEMIYDNNLAGYISALGYSGILCEGIERILEGKNCNQVYSAPSTENFGLLLRNANLSDDIAFRFADINWNEYPLTAEKFAEWIHTHPSDAQVINLFMDYETFGVHKKIETGIFDFLRALPDAILTNPDFIFATPGSVLQSCPPKDIYDIPQAISWDNKADRNIAYNNNVMQNNALKKIYSLEKMVTSSGSVEAMETWGKLQAADYFYYMRDEHIKGSEYKYVNPFSSAQEVYQYYANIVIDFEISLIKKQIARNKKKSLLQAVGNY
ncbi:MAG: glycoside hydrolase family 57 protein [Bacteroidetes bacterium]|nr:glycoside hydrolase family 57 protein [Bacteroidota bacterium]